MLADVDVADALGPGPRDRGPGSAAATREYRIGDLARAAGITVRTVRYYQERKLLPPPRRAGRVGWYSETHLARLRIIGVLLNRGHTLGGAGELLSAWEQGYDLATLLGIEQAMTASWSDDAAVPVTVAGVSALLQDQLTAEVLAEAIRLGYIEVDGDRVIRISPRLLETTTALVREGIPLPAILAAGRELQAGLDKMASLLVDLVIGNVLGRSGGPPRPDEVARLADTIERLRPVARTVIDTEFARAMDRRARVSYSELIRRLAGPDRPADPDGGQMSGLPGGAQLPGRPGWSFLCWGARSII